MRAGWFVSQRQRAARPLWLWSSRSLSSASPWRVERSRPGCCSARSTAWLQRGSSFPIPFFASSLLRIVTLSMLGILIGLAFGLSRIWLVILGLGFAQLALAGAAIREAVRR